MKRRLILFVVATLGCPLALAQPLSVTPGVPSLSTNTGSATNVSSAVKREDIVKLMKVTRTEQQIQALFPQMIAQFKKAMPDVTEAEWRQLEIEAKPQEMIALAVPIYDKHLTHEEVKGLIAFYETPLGQKSLDRMALITTELMQAGQEWGQRIAARIEKKHPGPSIAKTRTGPLTREEKELCIRAEGLDPALYDIDDNTLETVRKPPAQKAVETPAITVPPGTRYVIFVDTATGTQTYFSRNEPKPFGAGYKIDLGEVQITVSGNVRIFRVKKD